MTLWLSNLLINMACHQGILQNDQIKSKGHISIFPLHPFSCFSGKSFCAQKLLPEKVKALILIHKSLCINYLRYTFQFEFVRLRDFRSKFILRDFRSKFILRDFRSKFILRN
ncbi:MAG: hypothetical protein DRR00_13140 [Candidatus Parabeggiatoa sp. nov. 3]|nr:MAG: hypothetical protein DRR00_13140 [Gammaproteobacteria bacterium]RKZ65513.1 MAG: hypothetical protein DRQ99_12405 [Gammaproteobacteria bacterium]